MAADGQQQGGRHPLKRRADELGMHGRHAKRFLCCDAAIAGMCIVPGIPERFAMIRSCCEQQVQLTVPPSFLLHSIHQDLEDIAACSQAATPPGCGPQLRHSLSDTSWRLDVVLFGRRHVSMIEV